MVNTIIPAELRTTMHEEYIKVAYMRYNNAVKQGLLTLMADGLWCILEGAHDYWRNQNEVRELIHHSEECANWLNAGVRLELAGPLIYNAWAKRFLDCYNCLNLPVEKTLDTAGFNSQMVWMEEVDFDQPPLFNNIFLINRRRFVEDAMLSGKGSLLMYMLENYKDKDQNFLYRQTRQIILANGGGAPIDW